MKVLRLSLQQYNSMMELYLFNKATSISTTYVWIIAVYPLVIC